MERFYMNQGYNAYKTANIDTADKGKLLIICYDVAIKHGGIVAEMPSDYKNIEERNKHLYKMNDAISELISALNFDAGDGSIARDLYRLYEYMQYQINQSIVHVDSQPIREILGYLTELRDAWKIAAQNVRIAASGSYTAV
ncbi:MAG: flagellar export chaperone FliS [Chitinispirillales bacterium]|jgi:flagellar protein FliS|nr:flagellar export chaperone FliS [Chitinispirillales bacterium]